MAQSSPSALGGEAIYFFKLSGIKQARIHLNSIMNIKIIRVSVPHAVSNALFCCAFKWVNLAVPSGFAASVLETESYLQSDILQDAMVLKVSTKLSMTDNFWTNSQRPLFSSHQRWSI